MRGKDIEWNVTSLKEKTSHLISLNKSTDLLLHSLHLKPSLELAVAMEYV